MSAISGALRVALAIAGLFALIDVWQAAILAPGSLSPATTVWLLGLYGAAAAARGLAVGLLAALLGWDGAAARRAAAMLVAGGGTAIIAAEVAMSQFQPLSPWRPWAAAGGIVAGILAGGAARSWRRTPASMAWLAAALFVVGAGVGVSGGRRSSPTEEAVAPPPSAERRANLLVVLVEHATRRPLGTYGYERPTSPAMDAFAREGVQFDHAYSHTTWTKPATASLMTGRYPRQHQAYLQNTTLPENELLLPEALRAVGYRTGIFSGNPWVTREWGFDQGVDHFVSIYDERFARSTLFMRSLRISGSAGCQWVARTCCSIGALAPEKSEFKESDAAEKLGSFSEPGFFVDGDEAFRAD